MWRSYCRILYSAQRVTILSMQFTDRIVYLQQFYWQIIYIYNSGEGQKMGSFFLGGAWQPSIEKQWGKWQEPM